MTETEIAMPVEAPEMGDKKKFADSNSKGKNRKPRPQDDFDPSEPLVKPTEVSAPDETEHNAAVETLKKKIDGGEEKIKALDAEIEVLKGVREKQNAATKGLSGELRAFRDKIKEKQVEKDGLQEQLALLTDKKKQMAERIRAQRKSKPKSDDAKIDAGIAEIQRELETSTLDLKTEKEKINEIKKLTAQKDTNKELEKEEAALKIKEEQHEEMFQKYKTSKDELAALRTEERAKVAALDAAKAGAVVEGEGEASEVGNANVKIQQILGNKAEIVQQNKAHRAAMKELSVKVKIKFAEYREYQRAMAAYKDKMDRVEYAKRRAEQQERYDKMKEERKEKDKKRSEDKKRMEKRFAAVANGCQTYVGGLALRVEEADLRSHFEPFGTVTDVLVVRDNDTELSRGFAFVTFEQEDMAKSAIKEVNRKEIKNLCPPHGRLAIKIAEKSRQQKEWEKANPGKCPKKAKDEPKEDKVDTKEDDKAAEDASAADKENDDKPQEGGKKKAKGEKKQWEATRDNWQAENGADAKAEEEAAPAEPEA